MPASELPILKPSDVKKHLRPGAGRCAVQVVKANQEWYGETGTMLYIPDIATTTRAGDAHLGVVVAACEPYKKILADGTAEIFEPEYKEGDILIFGKYTGTEVTVGRENFIILFENDVLARWEGELPEEELHEQSSDSGPSDADLIRDASQSLHFEAPATRRESGLPPLPPGLG